MLSAQAHVLAAREETALAAATLRRSLAAALDDNDDLLAAAALVELAETLMAAGASDPTAGRRSEAAAIAEDAAELLATAGRVRWTGRVAEVRARLELRVGDGFGAMRAAQTALDTAVAHGTRVDEARICVLMARICVSLGDDAGADLYRGSFGR